MSSAPGRPPLPHSGDVNVAGQSADRDAEAPWRILTTRRDHRHFLSDPVPRETIERLLEVFNVAPSPGDSRGSEDCRAKIDRSAS
ncbi:nitroreductase family protein [Dietzia cinnamea]|uniref:nitroreductase family protein n=1 Tax=Dietzia cinnamea TaxID=321318 RepID=UPI00223C08B7|nr:nitroreductase family protein [Dietzia cinnamea]MCT2302011.1 nitroreductase family protein [Dietzia cinnamea]